jgi:RNA-directed DNA polymerase
MQSNYPSNLFERYADDSVVHCDTKAQAMEWKFAIAKRLKQCGLELHPKKTKIVYCKDANRTEDYELHSFDFLGFCFRPRL